MRNVKEMMLLLNAKVGSGMTSATSKVAKQLQDVENRIKSIGQKQTELKKLENQMNKAGLATDEFRQGYKRLELEMHDARIEAVRYRMELDKQQAAEKRLTRIQGAISKNNSALSDSRSKLFDGLGMAAAIAAPMQNAMEFESAMADVRKVVDDLDDPKRFQAMSRAIERLTTKDRIPMTADQLAQIVAAGGQAGYAGKGLLSFARDAAKMGIAFDITAEDAGVYMSRWRKSFDLTQKAAVVLADKINYLGNTSGASAPAISDVVTRIGPLGRIGGFASGEIAALGASMVAMGVEPERAATGIKKLIVTLNAGGAATKEQQSAFEKLGINAKTLAKRMQKDAAGGILDVIKAIKQLPPYEQTSLLKQLFGEEGLAAVGSIVSGMDTVENNLKRVGNAAKYSGSMQKEYETRSRTSANSLQLLNNQASSAARTFGSALLPELVKLSESIGPLIRKFVEWTEKNPKLWSTTVKVVTGLIALRIAMMGARYATLVFKGGVLEFASSLLKVAKFLRLGAAAQWLLNTSLYGCPIVWIIAGIAALGVGIYLLIRHWKTVRTAMAIAWKWFLKFATDGPGRFIPIVGLVGQIAKHWDSVTDSVKRAWNWIKRIWDIVKKFGVKTWGKITSVLPGSVKAHATGGIITSPHLGLVGEAGPEAIIPLSQNRNKARSLLDYTNQRLGFAGAGNTFNITIPITMPAGTTRDTIDYAAKSIKEHVRQALREIAREDSHRSMA
ncbi:MAG: phage tail tape measure protein [Armatimonadota bacterium]|nr:phage tail tape measure protein [bacterium]